MRTIEVLKYYGHGKEYTVEEAQDKIDALKKKHPDRYYVILRNMRGAYERYQVVQMEKLSLDWPSHEDMGLPPRPPELPAPGQSYEDLRYEQQKWRNIKNNALAPLKRRLGAKLNPSP